MKPVNTREGGKLSGGEVMAQQGGCQCPRAIDYCCFDNAALLYGMSLLHGTPHYSYYQVPITTAADWSIVSSKNPSK